MTNGSSLPPPTQLTIQMACGGVPIIPFDAAHAFKQVEQADGASLSQNTVPYDI